jgi:hypothetical protein
MAGDGETRKILNQAVWVRAVCIVAVWARMPSEDGAWHSLKLRPF